MKPQNALGGNERVYACPHGHQVARVTSAGAWLLSVCHLCEFFGRNDRTAEQRQGPTTP